MAFLGQDGWKAGLSVFQLGKVEEMESRLDKVNKEKTQKQMQVDTMQQAMEKLKRKVSSMLSDPSELNWTDGKLTNKCYFLWLPLRLG